MATALLNMPPDGSPTTPEVDGYELGGPDSLYEIVDGVMVEKPSMSTLSGRIATKLSFLLEGYGQAQRKGRAFTEGHFRYFPEARRTWRPDVAFVSFERWPRHNPIPDDDPWEIVPDLAIEVQSPSNLYSATSKRIRAFFSAGVQAVWIVDPALAQVAQWDSPTSVQVLQRGDMLDGGKVLPGFNMSLDVLFEDVPIEAS